MIAGGGGDLSSRSGVNDYNNNNNNYRDDGNRGEAFALNDNNIGVDADDDDLPVVERPIRVKSGPTFDPSQGGIDDDPNAFKVGVSNAVKIAEQFPPGSHPLEGVPHFNDLPAPEALASKSR